MWMTIEGIAQYAGISPAVVRAAIAHRTLHGVTADPKTPTTGWFGKPKSTAGSRHCRSTTAERC